MLVNHPRLLGRNLFRTLFYMPTQIPIVATTLIWQGVLNLHTGWLNDALGAFGIAGPDWLNSPFWVYPGLSLISVWGTGTMMLIALAGLQSVPTELYEAARIDGAGRWAAFRSVTVSYLPFTGFASIGVLVTAVIGGIGFVIGPLFAGTLAVGGLGARFTEALGFEGTVVELVSGALLVVILFANPNGVAD